MVSDAGFQDFFSAPYAGFGNVCRGFAAAVFPAIIRAGNGYVQCFLWRLHQVLSVWCGQVFMMFFVVWVSAMCFWFDS